MSVTTAVSWLGVAWPRGAATGQYAGLTGPLRPSSTPPPTTTPAMTSGCGFCSNCCLCTVRQKLWGIYNELFSLEYFISPGKPVME